MIFATVGSIPFPRLVEAVDQYACYTKHEVFIQSADKSYQAKNSNCKSYYSNIDEILKAADIIISHAGVGSIYKILQLKKPAVIISRRHALGEHIDDHQYELATNIKNKLPLVFLDDISELAKAIEDCQKRNLEVEYKSTRMELFESLKKDIIKLLA